MRSSVVATSVGNTRDGITELGSVIKMGMTVSLNNKYQQVALNVQEKN